jgi:hypothetical protein
MKSINIILHSISSYFKQFKRWKLIWFHFFPPLSFDPNILWKLIKNRFILNYSLSVVYMVTWSRLSLLMKICFSPICYVPVHLKVPHCLGIEVMMSGLYTTPTPLKPPKCLLQNCEGSHKAQSKNASECGVAYLRVDWNMFF